MGLKVGVDPLVLSRLRQFHGDVDFMKLLPLNPQICQASGKQYEGQV